MTLTATAAQCRAALLKTYEATGRMNFSTRDAAWSLLEILKKAPKVGREDFEDGLEPDGGSDSNEGRALRIFEDALDVEAAFILNRYLEIARELKKDRKRLKDCVRISTRGIEH